MSIIAKNDGGDFQKPTVGTVRAVCSGVFDLGTHQPTNPSYKPSRKIMIIWEIDEIITVEGEYFGKRLVVNNRYTLSLGDNAHLRKALEGWRGRAFSKDELDGFDIEDVKGKSCLLSLIENTASNGKSYINISTISPLMKGMQPMNIEIPFTEIPNWIRKIQKEGGMNVVVDTEDQQQEKVKDSNIQANTKIEFQEFEDFEEKDEVPFD